MNTEELISAIEAAKIAFNDAVAAARAAGLVVDLFVSGTGPAAVDPTLEQAAVVPSSVQAEVRSA